MPQIRYARSSHIQACQKIKLVILGIVGLGLIFEFPNHVVYHTDTPEYSGSDG